MIRLAERSDLSRIIEIYNEAILLKIATADQVALEVSDRKEWFDEHLPHEFPIYVYEIENSVVAWCSLSPYRKGRRAVGSVTEISYYVDSNFQKQRIGSILMDHMLLIAGELGFKSVIAILISGNEASIKLLQKFGFKEWGSLPAVVETEVGIFDHLYYGLKL